MLVLMIIALPIFGMIYLYFISGNLDWQLPNLPGFINGLLVGFSIGILIAQYVKFHQAIKKGKASEELTKKVETYIQSTRVRFYFLFLSSVISAVGLLFFKSEVYVVLFAVTLVFFSLAKPTPDRIRRLYGLNKADSELVRLMSRPD